MARDYKHAARRAPRRPARGARAGANWAWLTGGLAAGLLAGYFGYLYLSGSTQHGGHGPQRPPPPAAPSPPGSRPPPETTSRFDFYTLLPEMEVEISDEELDTSITKRPKPDEAGPYILQAGSFRRFEEADNLKARLALLGIEARIQTVIINDGDTWYRVRIGPFDNLRDLKPVRAQLKRNHIDFMLLRLGA